MDGHPGDNGQTNGDWLKCAVTRHERALTLYAAHILRGDADGARDAVQETFAKLCRQDELAVRPHLAEWLFAVCRNHALDRLRKEKRMTVLTETQSQTQESPHPTPSEVVETRETTSDVLKRLSELPPNQQEVLRLKFQHDLSYKQIAEVTGLSVSNVGFLIHTGLKSLRNMLAGDER